MAELFAQIRFSHGNKLKFQVYLKEICKREKVSESDVLAWLEWPSVVADPSIQGKQKSEILIQRLFERRFPETTKLIKAGEWQL